MLGWEFPPAVSGGLGVACYGLAKALNSQGVDVLFVLPKPRAGRGGPGGGGRAAGTAVTKTVAAATTAEVHRAVEQAAADAAAADASETPAPAATYPTPPAPAAGREPDAAPPPGWDYVEEGREAGEEVHTTEEVRLQRVTFVPLDAWLQPYMTATEYQRMVVEELVDRRPVRRWERRFEKQGGRWVERARAAGAQGAAPQPPNAPAGAGEAAAAVRALPTPPPLAPGKGPRAYIDEPARDGPVHGPAHTSYAGDLFAETERYARLALTVARGEGVDAFDVVHAHDWMTFEAGMAVAAAAGKPLVVQIHSTELDRAGVQANARIMEIERQGMTAADVVIAVSYKTKTQLIEKYGVDPQKIEVVYNAAAPAAADEPAATDGDGGGGKARAGRKRRAVLFLGRLTRQKGPDLFLRAAKKVLAVEPEVDFILAGKGDLERELKKLAGELGIRRRVSFPGFLAKDPAAKALKDADVYVMPSVSEPFGIATLDALAHDVPVIISKQSGVAEVLRHVLKVDFWDTDDLANKILAVLRHPPLAQTLRAKGQQEARQLSWEDSARRVVELYESLTEGAAEEDEGAAVPAASDALGEAPESADEPEPAVSEPGPNPAATAGSLSSSLAPSGPAGSPASSQSPASASPPPGSRPPAAGSKSASPPPA
jgi:glycosyltransferase involved in cell wall biosynthesis